MLGGRAALYFHPAMSRGLPRFFWIALVVGAAFLALFSTLAPRAVVDSPFVRDDGWTAIRIDGQWLIDVVNPTGPAAASLRHDDRIVAIDGDARAGRIGPTWQTRPRAIGQPYRLTIERSGQRLDITLLATRRIDSSMAWGITYLGVALTFFVVGMVMAIAKPEEQLVQFSWATGLLVATFMLWIALRPNDGVQFDRTMLVLGLVYPWHFVTSYLFLERFPHRVAAAPRWGLIRHALLAGAVVTWVARNLIASFWFIGPPMNLGIIDAHYSAIRALQATSGAADLLFAAGAALAILAVLRRNYKAVEEGNDRRRMRLLAWSLAFSFCCTFVASDAKAVATLLHAGPHALAILDRWRTVANAVTVIIPLALGYAVIKHRVLGFRLAIRLGIQYVLARNVLRIAAAGPIAWIAYTAFSHPDQTVSDMLFAGWAKLNLAALIAVGVGIRYGGPLSRFVDRRFFREEYDHEAILRRLVDQVKAADSIIAIVEVASHEIEEAVHVGRVLIFHHDRTARVFWATDTSSFDGELQRLSEDSSILRELERAGSARTVDDLMRHCTDEDRAWLEQSGIDLFVPITDIDRRVVGALMVGPKKSEEPFTSKDRGLLQLVAAQIGSAYEVLALREEVGRQQQVQLEVLDRLEERQLNVVKECPMCGACYDSGVERCSRDNFTLSLSLPVERVVDGKYRLDQLIGRGGMGAVYEARDLRLQRAVAIKVIKASEFGSTAAHRRFAREAQACARLDHARIVRVYDYGVLPNQAGYLVMERVAGESWRRWIERLGAFTPAAAADLLDQAFDGIAAAHAAGILHRDLKPDNLLITFAANGAPEVKVLDFGLAKVRDGIFDDPKSVTAAGLVMGTFGYMSPEQYAGKPLDERSDLYSLAVVALESLTGKLPFGGRNFHQTIENELAARIWTTATSPEHLVLSQTLERALAAEPTDRFGSVAELRDALIPAIRACATMPNLMASGTPTPPVATSVSPIGNAPASTGTLKTSSANEART